MRKERGECKKCGKPVYVLTGKDIPSHFRGWCAAYCDFIGRDEPDKPKYHHACYDVASVKEHQSITNESH